MSQDAQTLMRAKLLLWEAIRKNNTPNVRVILEAGYPIEHPVNPVGLTALHMACSVLAPNTEIIQLILEHHPNINSQDLLGRTPLHIAAASGNINAVHLLLAQPGIIVDAQSRGHETPLMRAVQFGQREVMRVLLQRGANPFLHNICEQDSFGIAAPTEHQTELVQIINQYNMHQLHQFGAEEAKNEEDTKMQE